MKDHRDDARREPRRRHEDDVDAELRYHLEGRVEELRRDGLDEETARAEAARLVGDLDRHGRRCRQVQAAHRRRRRFAGALDRWVRDVRHGARALVHRPAFSGVTVLVVALGVGATVLVFSLLNAYLLRALPYPEPDRLMAVRMTIEGGDAMQAERWPGVVDLGALGDVIEHEISWDLDGFTLVGDDQPETVAGAWVTPGYLVALGTEPAVGRPFTAAEAAPGGPSVAMISHGLWQRRFGGDPDIVGRTVTAYSTDRPRDGEAFTIVGVLAADHWHVDRFTDFLAPFRGLRSPYMVRLQEGVTVAEAERRMTDMARSQWGEEFSAWGYELVSVQESHTEEVRPTLVALLAAVGFVLLISCSSAAVLTLSRATSRHRELAIRRALGAARGDIARQLLVESLLLVVVGGSGGVLLAAFGYEILAPLAERQLATSIPGGAQAGGIEPIVLLFALGIVLLTTLVVAAVPIVALARAEATGNLSSSERASTGGRRARLLRGGLVVAEVAVSLALLVGAGLMVRTAWNLARVDLGYSTSGLLRANLSLPIQRYESDVDRVAFIRRLIERVQALPAVETASVVNPPPFRPGWPTWIEAEARGAEAQRVQTKGHVAGPGYFETMRLELLRGRSFEDRDDAGAPPVAIVSDRLARTLWPDDDPIGRRLRPTVGDDEEPLAWRTVVGVVADVRHDLVGDDFPDMYEPYAQSPRAFAFLMVRTRAAPMAVVADLERAVWDLDPELPLNGPAAVEDLAAEAGAGPRLVAWLLAGFAGFAVLLAVVGTYGVIAYTVGERRREVAIRLALGARREQVLRLFVLEGGRLVGGGIAAGLVAAALLGQTLQAQVHGVSTTDPVTWGVVVALLAVAAGGAIALPAWRAATADPAYALDPD